MIHIRESLPSTYNPKKVEYIEGVIIDNKKGKGSVPLNQEINYEGFVVYMRPSLFLRLAHSGLRDPGLASEYSGEPIGAPFLMVELNEQRKRFEVYNHEGRHRVSGILNSIGDNIKLPVHVKVKSSKARHLDSDMIKNAFWVSEEDDIVIPRGITFYLDGKKIE